VIDMDGSPPSFFGRGGRGESRGRGLLAAAMENTFLTSCLGGGRGGPVLIGGRCFSPNSDGPGLSIREAGAIGAGELGSPMDNGGSCGGSVGSDGGNDGRFDLVNLLDLRSRKEGGAGKAFENRDRPVLGV